MPFAKRTAGVDLDDFVFRPRTNAAACVVWVVLALAWLSLEVTTGWASAAHRLPLIGLISTLVYAVFGRPRVCVGTRRVLLVNIVRDVIIPFGSLEGIDTQYALTLTTADGRRFQAWAAPATGRFSAARMSEEDRKALTWSGPLDEIPASAGLRSDAGAVAVVIRRRWDPPAPAVPDGTPPRPVPAAMDGGVQIRWATNVLIVLAVFAVASVLVGFG